jgi:hypothetical protein
MFGWTRIFTLVAVAAVVAVVAGGAGAASTSTLAPATVSHTGTAGKINTAASRRGELLRTANLNTLAGASRYLRAIGLDPHGLVIQRGARNYAGPNCPGARWTCTSTAHPVIQIAAAGGKNTFLCTSGRCAVVQATRSRTATKTTRPLTAAAAPNKAICIKTTGLGQSCSINQKGATDNTAIVYENVPKTTGLTQTASQTAQITQQATGATNSNTACVYQASSIDGSTNASGKKGTPVTVTLNAHQSVLITQDAHGGNNTLQSATAVGACAGSSLTQNQTLSSTATGSSSITQNENAADSGPNVLLDIKQNQSAGYFGDAATTGLNNATFSQTNVLTAIANTPGPSVSQTQSSASGGISADVNQFSHGISTANATQTETQCEDAATSGLTACSTAQDPPSYSLTQVQYGPVKNAGSKSPTAASRSFALVRKDPGSIQSGNSQNTFTINQTSTQYNDTGLNQTNEVQGACATSGYCTVSQTTTVNSETTTNNQAGQNVDTTTSCTGSDCTAPTPGITFDGSPGTAAPPSTLGPYTMTPFGPDSQPSCPDTGSTVTGVIDPAGTIGFTEALRHDQTPAPGCWATWSHGYTGDVYDTTQLVDKTQVTITLPSGTNAFYFYAEPNTFAVFDVQATAQDTTTSGPIQVQGNSGAKYFGFYGTGGVTLATITVTTSDTSGFAVGEFGIQVAPPVID